VANDRIRAKTIPAVIADIRSLVCDLGFRRIAIEDNFFAHSAQRTLNLCRALGDLRQQLGISFSWDCQTRVESMRPQEVLPAMEAAGCEAVYLGVESFVIRQLHYLGKTRHPVAYIRMLKEDLVPRLLASSVGCFLNLQLGLPKEDTTDEDETVRHLSWLGSLAASAGKVITVFPMLHVVYPGTQHFEEGLEEGRFGPRGNDIFEMFTAWEAEQAPVLRWLGGHFAHGTGGIPEGILVRDQLSAGLFEVDAGQVLRIASYLDDIGKLKGIRVFKYGDYLAKMGHSTAQLRGRPGSLKGDRHETC
jgi:hypothetical protein